VPVGRGAGCTESTDPNQVRAKAMDGPSHKFARSEFGHAQHARRALHREVQRQSTPDTRIFSKRISQPTVTQGNPIKHLAADP